MSTRPRDDREPIMARIRNALRTPAPHRGQSAAGHVGATAASPHFENQLPIINNGGSAHQGQYRAWLPVVGPSWEERATLFASNAAALKADFVLCADRAERDAHLLALAEECSWKKVATHHSDDTQHAAAALGLPQLGTDDGYAIPELEACDVALTSCEALVAQTGSVLVSGRSCGGRALSVLPPHHVVLARRDQLIADLPAAFALLHERYSTDWPTMLSFITGPSRTGDIERILVLGAHGPRRLTIYCY
jgi:L-lactate dehydrogenase complex protein LldG